MEAGAAAKVAPAETPVVQEADAKGPSEDEKANAPENGALSAPELKESKEVKEENQKHEEKHEEKHDEEMLGFEVEKTLAELEKEEWYHGCLPLEDIIGLLVNDGEFLIRGHDVTPGESEKKSDIVALVTTKWGGKVQDYPIRYKTLDKTYIFTLDGINQINDIMKLVRFHVWSATPVKDEVILKAPIPKQKWELRKDKVKMIEKVGAGAFGEVWRGTLQENPRVPPAQVAIKVKKVDNESKAMLDEMYREARIMRQYRHKNVVRFYGVVYRGSVDAMIVMEYVQGGALNDYLKKNTNVSSRTRISYSIDAATGLAYLHAKGCMHRDVACRNCLIDVSKGVVKLTDFGMSKQGEAYNIPIDEKVPVKWQAPEVLTKRLYTPKSDVYSYGILIWEIFNNGEPPFKGVENRVVREKILDEKFRPPMVAALPLVISKVMKACWKTDPMKRPTMARVVQTLRRGRPDMLLSNWRLSSEFVKRSSSQSSGTSSGSSQGGYFSSSLRMRGSEMIAKGASMLWHPTSIRSKPVPSTESVYVQPQPKPQPNDDRMPINK
ncbi:hypothetical protein V3C99_006229 [Haemonchus contortus]